MKYMIQHFLLMGQGNLNFVGGWSLLTSLTTFDLGSLKGTFLHVMLGNQLQNAFSRKLISYLIVFKLDLEQKYICQTIWNTWNIEKTFRYLESAFNSLLSKWVIERILDKKSFSKFLKNERL